MRKIGLLILVGVFIVGIVPSLAVAHEAEPSLFTVATVSDLAAYPESVPASKRPAEGLLYVTTLPESKLVVILRPITPEEYGSFQVQAVGHQIIERQMLAAAIVFPLVTDADIVGFSPELILFLEQRVNAISGFSVFSVPLP